MRKVNKIFFILWTFFIFFVYLTNHWKVIPSGVGLTLLEVVYLLAMIFLYFCIGFFLLSPFKIIFCNRIEKAIFSISLGFGAISFAIFLLGIIGLFYFNIVLVFFILLVTISIGILIKKWRQWDKKEAHRFFITELSLLEKIAISLLSISAAIVFLASLVPPTAVDAMRYHLAIPKDYIQNHRIIILPQNTYSGFPQTVEMIYTLCLFLKDGILAQANHFIMCVILTIAIFCFCKRFLNEKVGIWSALIFFTIPIVMKVSTWAYVDLALSLFVFLSIYSLVSWWEERKSFSWLFISGIFAGLSMSTKYTGIYYFLILSLGLIVILRFFSKEDTKRIFASLGIFMGIGILVFSPWLLKNLFFFGNPVYPFAYRLLGGKYWDLESDIALEEFLNHWGRGHSLLSILRLPWDISISGGEGYENFDGDIGFLQLVFLPAFLFLFRRVKSLLLLLGLFLGISFIIWASYSLQARLLIPILSVSSILVAFIALEIENFLRLRGLIRIFLLVVTAFNCFIIGIDFHRRNETISFISGDGSWDSYIGKRCDNYPLYKFMEKILSTNSKILFVCMGNWDFYCPRKYISDGIFKAKTYASLFKNVESIEDIYAKVRKLDITHIAWNRGLYEKYVPKIIGDRGMILERQFVEKNLRLIYSGNGLELYEISLSKQ